MVDLVFGFLRLYYQSLIYNYNKNKKKKREEEEEKENELNE
jgi:hypothetical protein